MIVGVGLDIVSVKRLAGSIERQGDPFLERVFTDRELASCEKRKNRLERLAARFAAKEAGMKALGTGWAKGIGWRDFEVVGEDGERPALELSGAAELKARELGVNRIHLSLSHDGGVASAIAVMERCGRLEGQR